MEPTNPIIPEPTNPITPEPTNSVPSVPTQLATTNTQNAGLDVPAFSIQSSNNPVMNEQQPKKKMKTWVKVLIIIGSVFIGVAILFVVIFSLATKNSDRLECKTGSSGVTLYYNDERITGHVMYGVTINMDHVESYVKKYGIKKAIDEVAETFLDRFGGECLVKPKGGTEYRVSFDEELYEAIDNLSAFNNTKDSINTKGTSLNIDGGWKSTGGDAYFVFKNGEYWWYKSYEDLNDNYWHGKVQVIKGDNGLKKIGIDSTRIANLKSRASGDDVEYYGLIMTPDKIISDGQDKSSTNITGEDWRMAWILIDHGAKGIEAQVFNAASYDTSYYIKSKD